MTNLFLQGRLLFLVHMGDLFSDRSGCLEYTYDSTSFDVVTTHRNPSPALAAMKPTSIQSLDMYFVTRL